MKKALIAGAASAVLAAMPVVGVFAADTDLQKVDTLVLTIDNACTFSRGASAHGTTLTGAAWGDDGKSETTTDDANTLWATVTNATFYDGESGHSAVLGTSNFTVTCNNQFGYAVNVSGTAFAAETEANSTGTYAWSYEKGGSIAASPANSVWTVESDHTNASFADAATIAAQASAPVSDDTFTMTYKAYVDATQPADTYTATATYNFSQKANPNTGA